MIELKLDHSAVSMDNKTFVIDRDCLSLSEVYDNVSRKVSSFKFYPLLSLPGDYYFKTLSFTSKFNFFFSR